MSVDRDAAGLGGFSAVTAAFAGLGLARRAPRTMLVWGGLILAVSLVLSLSLIILAGPRVMQLQQAQAQMRAAGGQGAALAMGAMMAGLGPLYVGMMLLSVGLYAVLWAALNRMMLRSGPRDDGRLGFGGDELRQVGVMVLFGLTLAGVYLLLLLGGMAVGAALAATLGTAGRLLSVLVLLAVAAAVVYVAVRLSLAGPMTFDTGRVTLSKAWKLTRGRVWPLLGAYVLAWAVVLLAYLVFMIVLVAIGAFTGGGLAAAAQLFRPNMSSVATWLGPVTLINLVAGSLVQAVAFAVVGGVVVHAYGQLRPQSQAIQETFA